MKRIFALLLILKIVSVSAFSSEKKPTIMILPSDNWCESRYFMETYDNDGVKIKTPNYQQAFMEDSELPLVISKIGELLTPKGYSIKDAEIETKAVYARIAEDEVSSSKRGALITESPLDKIKRRAKMDILVQIWWAVNQSPQGPSVSFVLEAFDTYTSKRIATSAGTGTQSDEIISVMLEKAVRNHIAEFDKQMMKYYKDLKKNGREIMLTVRLWDDWDKDLETEYNGKELLDIIQSWLQTNTVKGTYNLSDASDKFAQFEQVRIPLFDSEGRALDARLFISGLRNYLSKPPYNISSKMFVRGLGEANLILGGK